MNPRLLLDTHIVVRWLSDLRRLTREQHRVLDDAVRHGVKVGVSAMSLVEIAFLSERHQRVFIGVKDLLDQLDANPAFRIFPLTTDIAREIAALGNSLRDPVIGLLLRPLASTDSRS